MPPKYAFDVAGESYSTLLHELSHSTGHPKRLNRDTITYSARFGSATYSKEELVAEFGTAYLTHAAGIQNTIDNSASYNGERRGYHIRGYEQAFLIEGHTRQGIRYWKANLLEMKRTAKADGLNYRRT